jgi:sugar-specific transcriptional regulator TrmB
LSDSYDERSGSILNLLTQFGLSKDEASLFVILSGVSKSQTVWLKGSDISKLSKKGRVRTYQILQRLLALGIANVNPSRPKKYSAVSPQVALRRLLSIQESRLTELSHLESEAIESLRNLNQISVEAIIGKEEERPKSAVTLLQGLANIQIALREALERSEVSIAIDEESADHISAMLSYISEKPKSARIILSTLRSSFPKHYSFPSENIELYWRKGGSPVFILANNVTMFLFYSKSGTRKKLLTPEAKLSTVSQMILIDSEVYTNQMRSLFDLILQSSRRVSVK